MSGHKKHYAAIAGLVIGGLTGLSSGAIIYQDNFDGTAGTVAARTPDTETGLFGGSASAPWTSDSTTSANPDAIWQASGGTYSGTGTTDASISLFGTGADSNLITNAYLPFTPQAGNVYDLHLAIASSGTGASGNWLGLAFAQAGLSGHTSGGGSSALSNDATYGLIIDKGSGVVQSFAGLGTANGKISTSAGFLSQGTSSPTYHTFDILLDTTNTSWTVSWLVDGVQPAGGSPFTYTTNPTIGNVIFGTNKLTGVVSDFSLTTVPEPASLGLFALGALGILRRKTCSQRV